MKKLLLVFVIGSLFACEKHTQPTVLKYKKASFHTDHLDGYDMINVSDSLTPSFEWADFDTIRKCELNTYFSMQYNKSYKVELRHSQNGFTLWNGYVTAQTNGTFIINQLGGMKTLTTNCGGLLFID